MKKLTSILIIALGFLHLSLAQNPELETSKREKLEALKVAFITEKLALTPDEAKTFWPVYNELENKMRAIRKERRQNRRQTKENHDSMSDKELAAAIEAELNFEQKELDLKKEYNKKFNQILPIKKVVLLIEAQESFKRKLLKGAKDHRSDGRPPH